jgi:hypothetical protein
MDATCPELVPLNESTSDYGSRETSVNENVIDGFCTIFTQLDGKGEIIQQLSVVVIENCGEINISYRLFSGGALKYIVYCGDTLFFKESFGLGKLSPRSFPLFVALFCSENREDGPEDQRHCGRYIPECHFMYVNLLTSINNIIW